MHLSNACPTVIRVHGVRASPDASHCEASVDVRHPENVPLRSVGGLEASARPAPDDKEEPRRSPLFQIKDCHRTSWH